MKYQLLLRNEKLRTYNLIGWILFFIQVVAFIAIAFLFEDKEVRGVAKTNLVVIAVLFIVMYALRKTKFAFGISVMLFWAPILWVPTGFYIIAGVCLLIRLLHYLATMKRIVRVDEDHITYPAFPANVIPWKNISTCLLKDGLLTLDLKNNKLFQHLLDEKTTVDEQDFNEFCREQLNKSH